MHLGDYKAGDTIPVILMSYGANGESAAMTGLAVTDIEIYKGATITAGNERTSDSGYTLIDTDGLSLDGIDGVNGFTIDTTDDTVAGWWTRNTFYHVIVNAVTVNSQNVVYYRSFSIEMEKPNDGSILTTVATWADATDFTLAAGTVPAEDNALNGWSFVVKAAQVAERQKLYGGVITDYTGASRTVVARSDFGTFTAAAGDIVYLIPPRAAEVYSVGATVQTAGDVPALVTTVDTVVDAILADTGTDGVVVATGSKTGYRLSATGVDDIFDEALSGHVAAGSFGAAMYIARSNTAQAGASSSITLDASASAVDDFYNNNWIFIVSGTGVGQGNTISDYNGTTKVASVQDSWATNPSSDSVFVIVPRGGLPGASAPTAADVADAVWDEALTDHTTEGSAGSFFQPAHNGTAQAGTTSSITLDATGSSATDDFYNYGLIHVIAGTGAGQVRQISDYNGTSKVATVSLNWTTTPSTDSQYVLKPWGVDAATVASIADGVWDEARSGHQTAGTFGAFVYADTIAVSGSTTAADGLEAATAGTTPLPSNVTQISGDSTAADNLESYTDGTTPMPVNMTQISADATAADNLEAMLDGTGGVTISANIDGYAEIRTSGGSAGDNTADLVAAILTTQMTESYSTAGAAPTLAQALMAIQQRLYDADVTGTTLTVRQLDGTTAAMTITVDNGTTPTDINRAT